MYAFADLCFQQLNIIRDEPANFALGRETLDPWIRIDDLEICRWPGRRSAVYQSLKAILDRDLGSRGEICSDSVPVRAEFSGEAEQKLVIVRRPGHCIFRSGAQIIREAFTALPCSPRGNACRNCPPIRPGVLADGVEKHFVFFTVPASVGIARRLRTQMGDHSGHL